MTDNYSDDNNKVYYRYCLLIVLAGYEGICLNAVTISITMASYDW